MPIMTLIGAAGAATACEAQKNSQKLGIYNGTVTVAIKDPSGNNILHIYEQPSTRSRERFITGSTRFDVSYPEVILSENPQTGQEGSGYWLILHELITDTSEIVNNRIITRKLDGFVSTNSPLIIPKNGPISNSTLIKPDIFGNYQINGRTISKEAIGAMQSTTTPRY